MKATCITEKVSERVPVETSLTRLIPHIEEHVHTPNLDTILISIFVKQRKRDALRIMELTLRAIEALEKTNTNSNSFYDNKP